MTQRHAGRGCCHHPSRAIASPTGQTLVGARWTWRWSLRPRWGSRIRHPLLRRVIDGRRWLGMIATVSLRLLHPIG